MIEMITNKDLGFWVGLLKYISTLHAKGFMYCIDEMDKDSYFLSIYDIFL